LGLNAEANYEIMAQVDEVKINRLLVLPKRSEGKLTVPCQHTACTVGSIT